MCGFHLDRLLKLIRIVCDDADTLFVIFLLFGIRSDGVDFSDFGALVSGLQVLLEERLVSEASIAVEALRHLQVNFVVTTERRFVTERHEASGALVRLAGAVNERMLLKGRLVTKLLSTQVANPFLDSRVAVLHVMLHRVLLPEALGAPGAFVRLLVPMDQH